MKILLVLLCYFILGNSVYSQKPIVRELAPGVFYYFGDELQQKSANCTWIVFNDFVFVVDANYPWGAEEIIREIRKTSNKPIRYVLNTHYHHDHTFGNDLFYKAGATIISTEDAAREMKTLGEVEWKNGTAYSGRNMEGRKRRFPTLTFNNSLFFDDGSHRVEIIRMSPAHTAGDAVVYLPNEKILITGDLFVNGNPWSNNVADEHADYNGWLRVLDTMASWDVEIVIPGHGEPATRKELRHQRNYLADLFMQVEQGIAAGKSKEELVSSVDLSRHPVYGENKKAIRRSVAELFERMTHKAKNRIKE